MSLSVKEVLEMWLKHLSWHLHLLYVLFTAYLVNVMNSIIIPTNLKKIPEISGDI